MDSIVKVPLGRHGTAGFALVDARDLPLLEGCTLHLHKKSDQATDYVNVHRNGRREKLHRLLLGAQAGMLVDHIDGNGLNNTRGNLRIATHAENMRNRKMHRNNTSGFRGAYWCAKEGRFRARIRVNGRLIQLGWFKSLVEAAHAYDDAARRYHGEFARLNYPEGE